MENLLVTAYLLIVCIIGYIALLSRGVAKSIGKVETSVSDIYATNKTVNTNNNDEFDLLNKRILQSDRYARSLESDILRLRKEVIELNYLKEQVHDLITRMDDLRVKDGRPVCEAVDDLRNQLDFHVERISDDMHVEDIDVYDWIAERDEEFANRCKVSYRYDSKGRLLPDYGDIYIGE